MVVAAVRDWRSDRALVTPETHETERGLTLTVRNRGTSPVIRSDMTRLVMIQVIMLT